MRRRSGPSHLLYRAEARDRSFFSGALNTVARPTASKLMGRILLSPWHPLGIIRGQDPPLVDISWSSAHGRLCGQTLSWIVQSTNDGYTRDLYDLTPTIRRLRCLRIQLGHMFPPPRARDADIGSDSRHTAGLCPLPCSPGSTDGPCLFPWQSHHNLLFYLLTSGACFARSFRTIPLSRDTSKTGE